MRKTYIPMLAAALLAGPSLASVTAALPTVNETGPGRRRYGSRMIGYPAGINRHTGQPHEHRREMARRVRQAAAR